jgi:hypothetical protein
VGQGHGHFAKVTGSVVPVFLFGLEILLNFLSLHLVVVAVTVLSCSLLHLLLVLLKLYLNLVNELKVDLVGVYDGVGGGVVHETLVLGREGNGVVFPFLDVLHFLSVPEHR